MEYSPLPPPLPPAKKSNIGLIIGITAGAIGFIVLAVGGGLLVSKVQKKAAEQREAVADLEKTTVEARQKTAAALEKGESVADGDVEQLKQKLVKSASMMSGDNALAARAISAHLTRMQELSRAYQAELETLLKSDVLAFKGGDRATLAEHRQIVQKFAVANDQLTEAFRHGEDLVRKELVAAKVPPRTVEATIDGYNRNRDQRLMQIKIREYDHALGEACLAAIDLLDKSWGKWRRDEAAGRLVFQDNATLATFNELMKKIQDAGSEQTKVQQELAQKIKASVK